MMIPEKDFKYYVVELSESSITSFGKYVCIPSSWIKFRETFDGEVLIKYPIEEISVTKRRIKKREESSNDWPVHTAEIKLRTNSYKEATNYIKILNKISEQEQSKKKVDGVPSKSSLTSETNVQTISALLSDDAKPVSNQTSEHGLTASKAESQEETKIENSSPKPKRYFTRQTTRISSPANTVRVDQTVENNAPDTSNCGNETVKHSQQHDSLVKSCEMFTDDFILRESLRQVLGDDYKEKIGMIYAEHKKRCRMFKLLYYDSLQHCEVFKALMEISDDDNNGKEVIPSKKRKVTWSGTQNNDDDADDDDDDDNIDGKYENNIESKTNNPSDKIRGQARKFTLPPEYDPENSKWTLKHREYKEGLVELTPNSQIYVDAIKLSNCKRMSKDSKTLARMLLLEVFRKSALSICSLTGKKANAFDLNGTSVRPGLDEHARNVLLNFVEQHATDQKWVHWDRPTILNTLRNKMQEMRGKYG